MKVLFVCLGNICRSPTAEGVFRKTVTHAGLADEIEVDSAGTGDWHIGHPPDDRAQAEAKERGYDLSSLRARQVSATDFQVFDYIIAMDHSNVRNLKAIGPEALHSKIHLFLSFHPNADVEEVPDPYYTGGFDHAFELIEAASAGFLAHLRETLST